MMQLAQPGSLMDQVTASSDIIMFQEVTPCQDVLSRCSLLMGLQFEEMNTLIMCTVNC